MNGCRTNEHIPISHTTMTEHNSQSTAALTRSNKMNTKLNLYLLVLRLLAINEAINERQLNFFRQFKKAINIFKQF